MSGHRFRQLLLFLLVLILPSIAILVAARRIATQDEKAARQDAEERAVVERKRTAEDIGNDLLVRLERIKLQEITNAPVAGLPALHAYSDAAVAAVGWLDDDRLVWPWDLSPISQIEPTGPEFTRVMADAEHAEFNERLYDHAAELYRAVSA